MRKRWLRNGKARRNWIYCKKITELLLRSLLFHKSLPYSSYRVLIIIRICASKNMMIIKVHKSKRFIDSVL